MIDVTVRTLSNWKAAEPKRVGRPPTDVSTRREALRLVARASRRQGRSAGWRPIAKQLEGRVPTRLVQSSLRACKRRHAGRLAAVRERNRISVKVHARDALWGLDATHLGRVGARAIEGEVLRDPASRATPGLSAGPPADAVEVVALLEHARRARGTLPLVLMVDNGRTYRSELLAEYLEAHLVVAVSNLPHTPQHNAFVERAHGELKAESGLGRGIALHDEIEAAQRLAASATRLDTCRLRACLGYRTAAQADAELPRAGDLVDRVCFFREARCAMERAVLGCRNDRERRRAIRNSIYATLEANRLITRTRGGVPLALVKPEGIS